MSQLSRKIFITPNGSKVTHITSVPSHISSKVPVKTSLLARARESWFTIVVSLVAIAAILGIVGLAVGVFAFSHSTTLSSKCSRQLNISKC